MSDIAILTASAVLLLAVLSVVALLFGQGSALQRLRLLAEQALAAQRSEAETLRASLASTERALSASNSGAAGQLRLEVSSALAEMRTGLDARLRELRESNDTKLAEIQKSVNEQLHDAVTRQMTTSFAAVSEQFSAVQKAMGDVQAVAAQIGDIKRLFGNVKTRGGWGETQVRAMLDDVLPPGAWEANWKPRADSDDMVDFAVLMPVRGEYRPRLPIDAKFPMEDYERLLLAAESGDAEGERGARRGLERQVREECRKIQAKYIAPPSTVEFAVMYLATEGLYAEIARAPGLIDELGRVYRVLVLGPSLFPAMLRTIHLGYMTLALEQKADEVRQLLGATRSEMIKMDVVLDRLFKQAGTFSNTIEEARRRTRAVGRKLRSVEAIDDALSEQLLDLTSGNEIDTVEEPENAP